MEHTKDIIFSIKYNKEKDCLELNNNNVINKFRNLIRKNKAISIITIISTFLIIWDIILISNFINLLSKL
ncbi:MAG: hypothetical protein HFJ20_03795 [Clostridia bacterium]|nr:hypothetical protein [Clostridia bacterium]